MINSDQSGAPNKSKTGSEDKVLSLDNLSIGYFGKENQERIVKDRISFGALKGELIALIGSNGIGKSTLLKTIAGIQKAIAGEILINNYPLESYNEKDLAKLISFVSTEIIRVSNLTVYDLIALGRYPHTNWAGRLTAEDRGKIDQAIGIIGLKGFENRMINYLSDGERQKAMIARTLSQDTDIILLDEPTAFLDLANKHEIVHLLHHLAGEKGKTVIFSTHDLSTAIAECDKVWLILSDKIIEGSPEDLILDGNLASLFQNDNLFFDPEKGDFRIKKQSEHTAVIIGEGNYYTWTINALEKNGFKIVEQNDGDDKNLEIIISGTNWILKHKGREENFNTLYSVSRFIKNNLR